MSSKIECPLEVLNEIESINYENNNVIFESNLRIILTSITKIGISEKKIFLPTELDNLGSVLPQVLSDHILNLLNCQKTIDFIRLKDDLGLEILYVVEIIRSINSMIILGAGHVGRSLSIYASMVGYDVILVDDREKFLEDETLSYYGVRRVISCFESYFNLNLIHPNCAIVIVTRGHQFDEVCLRNAIYTKAKYIGMIGSKRRVLNIINNIRQEALKKEQLHKLGCVYAPIGVEIGAKSPQEIAISILAQVIQVINCT